MAAFSEWPVKSLRKPEKSGFIRIYFNNIDSFMFSANTTEDILIVGDRYST